MSAAVWKFALPTDDVVVVSMPAGAKVLSVGEQFGDICLWAIVDTDAPVHERLFTVRGTGHSADDLRGVPFVGTVMLAGGAFVLHVWDGHPSSTATVGGDRGMTRADLDYLATAVESRISGREGPDCG